ncbi:2-isopropylmalate synthase [Ruminococcus flavefaciens]|uniref:2-isopropylmalate synthase n=1 Tax=Ruminococcus flavefaciens TaxID=1265 RepID=A0A1H6J5R2_RUMFL|nr:2-isopropylmalate synthase [Ruminococcus flavefaciens]SEH57275.1 2-isopropylmalate synthase [Ruminococcus flavefaciens]
MNNVSKYTRQFFEAPKTDMKWTQRSYVDKAPVWCSVDLRDGNQALIVPMSLGEKLEFFKMLVDIGFKEIEIGFPAASDTEYNFCRALIEQELIPDDVAIQVLTQSREHIIEKTFEALKGCKNAIVHLYNSTSVAQREQVFRKSKEEITDIAVSGAKLCKEYRERYEGNFRFEYSPESFTGTEPEFALEVCNAVLDVWQPTPDDKVIINLPVTVQLSMPHVYANQVEYMCENLRYRENVIVSLHPHNDRGCAIADTEMGLLAGADRVEGTLFGNGERTGNVDIITLAMNMYSQGIDPKLELGDIPSISEVYSRLTNMSIYERQPYSGKLVFAAFSGSHQDAIAKGMKWREEKGETVWNVPYLPLDPKDIGREYESDVIRINSQSGKGGIGYILETRFGYDLPKKMRENVGYLVKGISDRDHRELLPDEVYSIFKENYVDIISPIEITETHFKQRDGIEASVSFKYKGRKVTAANTGNGRLDAVSNAIRSYTGLDYSLNTYSEHALEVGSASKAVSYVEIVAGNGMSFWGTGIDNDIITSSVKALVSAVNNMLTKNLT